MDHPIAPPPADAALDARLRLLLDSHLRVCGQPLLVCPAPDDAALRRALWEAPRVIVAHGTEADPMFFYGNRLALQLFEFSFADFSRLPSRYSAEPLAREARSRLLEQVARQGYVDDYAGVRIASSGRRFMIERATVWNLVDADGHHHGQAATFSEWTPLAPA